MAQFTSSAKTLTYYVDNDTIHRLCQSFGNRLEKLTQEEKYQLCTAIALMLWGCCDSGDGQVDDVPYQRRPLVDDEFADLMDIESEPDLITTQNDQLVPEVTAHVMTALVILQNLAPEILAQLLPAVAEYARDDDR